MSTYASFYIQRNQGVDVDLEKLNHCYDNASTREDYDEASKFVKSQLIHLTAYSRSTALGGAIGNAVPYDQYVELTEQTLNWVREQLNDDLADTNKYIERANKRIAELRQFTYNEKVGSDLADELNYLEEVQEDKTSFETALIELDMLENILTDSDNKLYVLYA